MLPNLLARLRKARSSRPAPLPVKLRPFRPCLEPLEVRELLASSVPTVSAVSPNSGSTSGGGAITITGTNFTSVTKVLFGTITSTYSVTSSTQIIASAPSESAGTVNVQVVTPSGTSAISSNDLFTFQSGSLLPTVTGVSPNTGPTSGGTSVTIAGTNFTNVNEVLFGNTPATNYHVTSSSQIVVTASPAESAGTVNVQVVTSSGSSASSSSDLFTYQSSTSPPTVTSVSPNTGSTSGGNQVVVAGSNFTNVTKVMFGSQTVTAFTVNSPTQLTLTAPATSSSGAVNVQVVTSSGESAVSGNDVYTYQAPALPTLTAISPNAGALAGGNSLTITGTNFTNVTEVMFGTQVANTYTVNSPTQITVTVPAASAAGTVDVRVVTSAGTTAVVAADEYTFNPALQVLNPGTQTAAEGASVSLALSAEGANGNSLTWSSSNLPAGLSLNTVSGLISGTVGWTAGGTYSVTVSATETSGTSSSQTFTWTITNTNQLPLVAAPPEQFDIEGDTVSLNVQASDIDGDALSYSAGNLPKGLAINAQSGNISGTIATNDAETSGGTYQVTVTAANSWGPSSETFTWVVSASAAPVVNSTSYSIVHDQTLTSAPGLLASAVDPDGDTLTASVVTSVQHGTLKLNSDGTFTYTPNTHFVGTDSFTFQANDGNLSSNVALVVLHVTDSAPVDNDAVYTLNAGTVLQVATTASAGTAVGVLTDATDGDNDALTAAVVSTTTHGTLVLNNNGSFTYTPNAGFVGTDSFTYQTTDGIENGNVATVTLYVTDVAPVALADAYTLHAGTTLTEGNSASTTATGVLGNDYDAEGYPLLATLVISVSDGTLVLQSNGSFVYTPKAGFVGTDSFSYKANDGFATSNVATVTLQVTDTAPVAYDNAYSVQAGTTLSEGSPEANLATGVLANAVDVDNDKLSATVVTNVTHGTLALAANGAFTYTPNAGFVGQDDFSYQVSDGSLTGNTATVTLNVTDAAPVAYPSSYTVPVGTTYQGYVSYDTSNTPSQTGYPAGYTLTPSLVSTTTHGTLTWSGNGSFTYVPAAGFAGTDSFTYKVSDGTLSSDPAVVTLNVTDTTPTAHPDTYVVQAGASFAGWVLDNDTTAADVPLTAVLDSRPGNGTLVFNTEGEFTYISNPGFVGTDTFTYQVSGGGLLSAPTLVSLEVIDLAPVAESASFSVQAGTTLTATTLLTNVSNFSGNVLTTTLVTNVQDGSLRLNNNGTFTYTPNAGFTGTDSFTYQASDGTLTSNLATVTIVVTDTPPVVANSFYSFDPAAEDSTEVAGNVLNNESDPESATVTAVLVSGPSHGTLTLEPDGFFTYQPATGFLGQDSFTFEGTDGALFSNVATVTLTMVHSPPTASNATFYGQVNTAIEGNLNDYANDLDDAPLTASIVGQPVHGNLTLATNGDFTYTPNSNWTGTDSFSYQVNDGLATSQVATITLNVSSGSSGTAEAPSPGTSINPKPDTYSVVHDQLLLVTNTFGVAANDGFFTSGSYAASVVQNVSNGTLDFQSTGVFSYLPNPGFVGTDRFTYSVNGSGPATVTINVTDSPPQAVNDTYSIAHDTSLIVPWSKGVLANDSDSDQDTLNAILVTPASHGQLTLNSDGSFLYVPNPGFIGTDEFTYQANDGVDPVNGIGNSNVATVTINVTDTAPVATSDTYTLQHDTTLAVTLDQGLLSNDTAANNSLLTASLVSGPQHGTLVLEPSGAFAYTPNPGFVGSDTFAYAASDGVLQSLGTVTFDVIATAPVATSNSYSTAANTTLTISPLNGVLANATDAEGNTMTAVLVNGPAHGSLTLNAGGSFVYAPNPGFVGSDAFTYLVNDGYSSSNVATATISVTDPMPEAVSETYNLDAGISLSVSRWNGVLALASDTSGLPLTALLIDGPTDGTLTLAASGAFTYVPNAGFAGIDAFTFQASDGTLLSNVATITLDVEPNTPPSVTDTSYTTVHDTSLIVPQWQGLLASASDSANLPLTPVLVKGPADGTLTLNSGGSFLYTPNAGFLGTDSFTYYVSDGTLASNVATALITLTDTAPTVAASTYSTNQGTELVANLWGGVLAGAADADGDPLHAVLVSGPAHGTLTLSSSGAFQYVPNASFSGVDSFVYEASNGMLPSAPAVATITVTAAPPPVVIDADYGTTLDVALVVPAWDGVLAGATDFGNGPLLASVVTGPIHGTLSLSASGAFAYTPNSGYVGPDSFTYQGNDNGSLSNVATILIDVDNLPPVAGNVSYQATSTDALFASVANGVLANSSEADGDPLTAVLVTGPAHGTLTLGSSGSFTYVPAVGYTGTDSFTFQVSDGQLLSNIAMANITVSNATTTWTAPAAPVAVNQTYSDLNDQTLTVAPESDTLLANATDPSGFPLTAVLVAGPSHGSLDLAADGSFNYTPTPGYVGTDSFTYQASDGLSTSNTATVTLNVLADLPVVPAPTYVVAADQPLQVDVLDGVLSGAWDAGGEPLSATLASNVSDGTLSFNSDGSFVYTPNAGFVGTDSFSFTVSNGVQSTAAIDATIDVTDTAPTATAATYSTPANTPLVVSADAGLLPAATNADGQPLTTALVAGPSDGTLTLDTDGSFTYVPNAGFAGSDSFTYDVSDGVLTSSAATVTLTITDTPPTASNVSFTTLHDTPLEVTAANGLLTDASDPSGNPLTASLVAGPSDGTLTLNADGSFIYTPKAHFAGSDSFTYEVSDGVAASNVATVSLTVTDSVPMAAALSFSTVHDTPLVVSTSQGLLSTASDSDGDALTVTLVAGPSDGSLDLTSDGAFTYVPNAGYVGSDSFTYEVTDGVAVSNVATISLTVTNVVPVASNVTYTVAHDTSLYASSWDTTLNTSLWTGTFSSQGLLSSASDSDGDPLTVSLVTGPTKGTLTLDADGTFAYTPDAAFVGTDSFTYDVSDGLAISNVATVTLTVTGALPVAKNTSYTVQQNGILSVTQQGVAGETGQTTPSTQGNLLALDPSDATAGPLTFTLLTNVSDGTLDLSPQGSFLYEPDLGFVGTDYFTYEVSNSLGTSNTATVTLNVINLPPTVSGSTYAVASGGTLNLSTAGVLYNAQDPNGDALTAQLVSGPSNGTLSFNSNGIFTYTPNAGFVGNDKFTYRANDGTSLSAVATVTINVLTDALSAQDQDAQIIHDAAVNVANASLAATALGNEQDQLADQFDEEIAYEASAQADSDVVEADEEPAEAALAQALAQAEGQDSQTQLSAEQSDASQQEADALTDDQAIQSADAAYNQALQTAQQTDNQAVAQAQATDIAAVAAADSQLQSSDATAQATQMSAVTQADTTYDQTAAQDETTYNQQVAGLDTTYNAAVATAQTKLDGLLDQAQTTYNQTQALAQSTLQAALAGANSSRDNSATQAATTRAQTISQALTTYNAAVAQAQATYADGTQDQSTTATLSLGSNTAYLNAVATAQQTYETTVEQADNTYNSTLTTAQNSYNSVVVSADATYDSAVSTAQSTEQAALAAANSTYNQAAQTALSNHDSAVTTAANTYNQAIQTAQTAYAQAEQAADLAYDQSSTAADQAYNQAVQAAQQTDAAAQTTAQAVYESTLAAADQTYATAYKAAQTVANTALATASATLDSSVQSVQNAYQADLQEAQQTYNEAILPSGGSDDTSAFEDLDSAVWSAITTRQAQQVSYLTQFATAAWAAENIYNGAVTSAQKVFKLSSGNDQFNQASAFQAANMALLEAQESYSSGSSQYQQAQQTFVLACDQANVTAALNQQTDAVTFVTAEENAAITKANSQSVAQTTLAGNMASADEQETDQISAAGATYAAAVDQAQATLTAASEDAAATQAEDTADAEATYEDSVAQTQLTQTDSDADALAAWQDTEADARQTLQDTLAAADDTESVAVALAAQTQGNALAAAGLTWAKADGAADVAWTTSVATAEATVVDALAQADAGWETALSNAWSNWDSSTTNAVGQAVDALAQAQAAWQTSLANADSTLEQTLANATQTWQDAEAPAWETAAGQMEQSRATAIASWASGQGTFWAQYLDSEAGDRATLLNSLTSAQGTLEEAQTTEAATWWQSVAPAEATFSMTLDNALNTDVDSQMTAEAGYEQSLDTATASLVDNDASDFSFYQQLVASAGVTDAVADARADSTWETAVSQAALTWVQQTDAATEQEAVSFAKAQMLLIDQEAAPLQNYLAAEASSNDTELKADATAQKGQQQANDQAQKTWTKSAAVDEAQVPKTLAQADATQNSQQAKAAALLQQQLAAGPVQQGPVLGPAMQQQAAAVAQANKVLAIQKGADKGQVNVNAAQQQQQQDQQRNNFSTVQPQAPQSFWKQALFALLAVVIVVAVAIFAFWAITALVGSVATAAASMFVSAAAATAFGGTVSFVTGLGLTAGLLAWGVNNAWNARTSNPLKNSDSVGLNVLGTFLDVIGVGGIYDGWTGEDLITGKDLQLSENDRGWEFGSGVGQFGLTLYGGWSFWKWVRTPRPAILTPNVALAAPKPVPELPPNVEFAAPSPAKPPTVEFAAPGPAGELQPNVGIAGAGDPVVVSKPPVATGGTAPATVAAPAGVALAPGSRAIMNLYTGPNCFAPGTLLLTPEGSKPIEQFQPGDLVLSRSEHDPNGQIEAKAVEEVFVRVGLPLWLTVSGRRFGTTHEHPIHVVGKGWVVAAELKAGDALSSHNGVFGVVEKVVTDNRTVTLYNLRVSDYHTYFVGCAEWGFSVWAHNACIVELTDAAEIAANGGNKFKIVEGSKTIGYHADRAAAEKWLDLASDPAVGRLRPDEAATALRVEQAEGTTLKRYNPPPGKKGDWIDGNGVVYDGVSPAPSAHFARQFDNWKASLADHIAKVDKAVVDLNGKGLTPAQVQQVIDHIDALPAAERAKVILLK